MTSSMRRTAAGERQALASSEGRPALLVGYYDITERTEAQKALADQLKFTEALLDTMPNPMFVKDAERNYVRFNRACGDVRRGPRHIEDGNGVDAFAA